MAQAWKLALKDHVYKLGYQCQRVQGVTSLERAKPPTGRLLSGPGAHLCRKTHTLMTGRTAGGSEPRLCEWFPRPQDRSKLGISPGLACPGLPPVHRLPLRPQREVSPPCTHLSRASRWVSGSFSPRKQLKLGCVSGRGTLGRGPDPARSTQRHSLCSFLVLHVVQPNYWPQFSCRFSPPPSTSRQPRPQISVLTRPRQGRCFPGVGKAPCSRLPCNVSPGGHWCPGADGRFPPRVLPVHSWAPLTRKTPPCPTHQEDLAVTAQPCRPGTPQCNQAPRPSGRGSRVISRGRIRFCVA